MSGRKRIAILRISQETNSHSPVPTTLEDFERIHWVEGPELLERCGPKGDEAPGWLANAELSGAVRAIREHGGDQVEIVPLFSAWAIPGGPLTKDTCDAFCAHITKSLVAAGKLDGIVFSMHGALGAHGVDDPEAAFLEHVRAVVGTEIPVAVCLDLHGQLTTAFVEHTDIITGYRTNPHRDHDQTGYRAGRALTQGVLGKVRPTMSWRTLPLVLGGGTTIDFLPTMRPLFRHMKRLERNPKVLDVSLFMCHIWNDSPDLGWSITVVTDGDEALAERISEELADMAWAVRHPQPPTFPTPQEALAKVRTSRARRLPGTICMCDASDIVGAGAAGENTRLLRSLLEHGKGLLTYVPLRDAPVIDTLWSQPTGSQVAVEVGGKLDPHNPVLPISGRLLSKQESDAFGRVVVLEVDHVRLVLTEHAPMAMKPEFYSDVGLSVWRADIVVVKSLFPFRLYFLLQNRKTVYVRTEGATDFNLVHNLTFNNPVHPVHEVREWRPTDRLRRGARA